MENDIPNSHTLFAIGIFAVLYLVVLLRKAARHELDIYDFSVLSTVVLLPVAFAFIPTFAGWISRLTGVAFPFVVMFGLLIAVLFAFNHRLITKVHKLERESRLLIQEVSLLRTELKIHSLRHDEVA